MKICILTELGFKADKIKEILCPELEKPLKNVEEFLNIRAKS